MTALQKNHNEMEDAFGDLPEWDLSDLYSDPESDALSKDLAWLETEGLDFAASYEGKLSELRPEELLTAIQRVERLDQVSGRILSYAGLRYYQNTTDPERSKFLADCQEKVTAYSTPRIFFSLEFNRIADEHYQNLLEGSADLKRYKPVLDRMRAMKPYQLSDELEKFLHDKSVVGADAWNRLFDETMAALEFEVNGRSLQLEATLNLLQDKDRSEREAGARALAKVFQSKLPLFARVTNTLIKEKEVEDNWRGFSKPQSRRHLANDVEEEVVDALRDAVVAAYPKLSHRYYALKAKWLGLEKLQIWDRNAPLPQDADKIIPWSEAKAIVLDAYGGFDPKMAELAAPFFDKGWIDAGVKEGKAPGAFAHPTVSDAHPYVLLNYMGKSRDVMTLAHELGHGVHQRLAAKQGELLSSTPLTLAETASVFGEMLTFKKLLAEAPDPGTRKNLMAGKVEDMINTVVRQIAFYDFECRLHEKRKSGELTPDMINAIWMDVQRESLGPSIEFMDGYESFWTYIPHFIHSPFYVYAYAFGDGLVNALYAAYEHTPDGFAEKYFEMLKAGGAKHHSELLKPFGLDASDPKFWDKGLSLISGMIDALEEMG